MSRYGTEKACYDLAAENNRAMFRSNPDGYLARYPLTSEERETLKRGDVGALACDRLVIAARIERRLSDRHFAGAAHCDNPTSAVRCMRVLQVVKAQARMRPPNRIDFVTILGM